MLEAKKLTVKFGDDMIAVRNADLCIGSGEVVSLCGPNGAGKSTLLAALAGDLKPFSGQALLDGQDISDLSPAALAKRRAVLEQTPLLTAAFTVTQLAGLSIGVEIPPATAQEIIDQSLADVGLTQEAQKPVQQLSGGQRHRAHLARILSQLAAADEGKDTYLLMDEPTASLDLAHQISVMKIARRIASRGAGVLVVLHDLNLASAYSDRSALMCNGELLLEGAPIDVLTEDLLTDVYETKIKVDILSSRTLQILPVFD